MISITKELLSKVLEVNASHVIVDLKTIHYNIRSDVKESEFVAHFNGRWNILNKYEMAHRCKEWAYTKGYVLVSTIRTNSALAICEFSIVGNCDYKDEPWNNFRATSEPEAVFKAVKWILENK
jgi:hypothetical protein